MSKIYKLNQIEYFGFLPDKAHSMIILADTEAEARNLAEKCELERECGQHWTEDFATCEPISIYKKGVILVS